MLSLKRFTDQPALKLAAQKAALEAATAETAKTAKAEAKSATETAKKLLDTSAEKNRNLLIALMAYLATATILCLSITDLDLLVDQKTIQLPLLSVGLPMWAFYTVIPLFLVLLHFDVLQNVQEHRLKLNTWLASLPEADKANAGNQLFPYILDFAQVRYGNVANPSYGAQLVAAGVWLMYVYLPLAVLATFFIRFADLQGVITSSFHIFLMLAEVWLLSVFWVKLRFPTLNCLSSAKWFVRIVLSLQAIAVSWVFLLWFAIQVLHFLDYESAPAWLAPRIKDVIQIERKLQNLSATLAIAPRITLSNVQIRQVKEDDIRLAKWKNPSMAEFELFLDSPSPFNLSARRLAFSELLSTQLIKIDFTSASLQYADLRLSQLQGANFKYAKLQGIILAETQMQETNFLFARMQEAYIKNANLQGAIFTGANLRNADFSGAKMQGVRLSATEMQGATFMHSELQGADLDSAKIQGADFSGARLVASIFTSTKARGVSWPNDKSAMQGIITFNQDLTNYFDFSPMVQRYANENRFHYVFKHLVDSDRQLPLNLQRFQSMQVRSGEPPKPIVINFNYKIYSEAWLSLLCKKIASHRGMLNGIPFNGEEEHRRIVSVSKAESLAYINRELRCKPYRKLSVDILE